MTESEDKLNHLLMKAKEENEKTGLKHNIKKKKKKKKKNKKKNLISRHLFSALHSK